MPSKTHKAPGKSSRKGIGIEKLFEMFPRYKVFESMHWPEGRHCPHCEALKPRLSQAGNHSPIAVPTATSILVARLEP